MFEPVILQTVHKLFCFGVVVAFCRLVPTTDCHVRNDVQVTADKRAVIGLFKFEYEIIWIMRFMRIESIACISCEFVS